MSVETFKTSQISSEQGVESTPLDWETIDARIDEINIPDDINERAEDVAANFKSGLEIQGLLEAVHDVAVPDVTSQPTKYAMGIKSPDGERRVLMDPSAREGVFSHAGKLIEKLSHMRTSQTEQQFLDRSGDIIALASVLTHQYADGNGRVARIVGELIRHGRQNPDDLRWASQNREKAGSYKMISYLPRTIGAEGMSAKQILDVAAGLEFPLEDNDKQYSRQSATVYSNPYRG